MRQPPINYIQRSQRVKTPGRRPRIAIMTIIRSVVVWISLVSSGFFLGSVGSAIHLQATHQPTAEFDGQTFHFAAWRGADLPVRINTGAQALGEWAAPGGIHLTLTSVETGSRLDIVVCTSSEADWGDSIPAGFTGNEDLTLACDPKVPSNISGPETQHFTGQLSGQIIYPVQNTGSLTFDNVTKQLAFPADFRLGPDPITDLGYDNAGGILGGISLIPGCISLFVWIFMLLGAAIAWLKKWWSRRRTARQAPASIGLTKPTGSPLLGLFRTLYGLCFLTMLTLDVLISTNVVQGPSWLIVIGVTAGGYLLVITALSLVQARQLIQNG